MPKRSITKRGKGGKALSTPKLSAKKAPANKGKAKAKASIAGSVKSDDGKSDRANSVIDIDDEDDDVEELVAKVSPGSNSGPDLDDIPIYSKKDVERILSRILGEEYYGFEDKYDDEDTSHIPPNAEQRRRNGRQMGRDLIIWNRPYMDAKLLLTIYYECARYNVEIPWDAIAHRLHPGSSGSAILQHLGRLRNVVFVNGHMVPPDLPKGSSNSQDPSLYVLRGFVRMPVNVRWSPDEPLFAAKRAITFKEKFEHSPLNLGDVHCLPFDGDTALEYGIIVDENNKILRQNNRKVPKSKVKVGAFPRKKITAKDTSSATAFATTSDNSAGQPATKPSAKSAPKKTSAKRAVPSPDSDDDFDPSAKSSSARPRPSRAAKRVKTYHEVDPEDDDDDEPSEVLEVQEAGTADVSNDNQAGEPSSAPAQEDDEADGEYEVDPVAAASPHSQQSPIPDALGLFSGSVRDAADEVQVPSDDEDANSGDDGDGDDEPTSFVEMLASGAEVDENDTGALDLAEAQQSGQMSIDHMVHPYFGHYGAQVPNDGMTVSSLSFFHPTPPCHIISN
ncbi:hypothetical protein Sste5346_000274 [Sporothrix stenoceras]|uniref:Uncharacterized protein n=1 Tax=Sporothrix stenoceras TaxID=5173 RepID=A0ABR3ZUT1_9PEZI